MKNLFKLILCAGLIFCISTINAQQTSGYLLKYSTPPNHVNSVIKEVGGKLGIGNVNPTAKVDISGKLVADTIASRNLHLNSTGPMPAYIRFGYNELIFMGQGYGKNPVLMRMEPTVGTVTFDSGFTTTAIRLTKDYGLNKVLVSDDWGYGHWELINNIYKGDNLGDHIARENIILGNYALQGLEGHEMMLGPNGEPWQQGLKFLDNNSGSMRLSSFRDASFHLESLHGDTTRSAIYWASSTSCGGYGFGLSDKGRLGGIFWKSNPPTPIMTFDELKIGIGRDPGDEDNKLFVKDGIYVDSIYVSEKVGIGCHPGDQKYRLYVKDGILTEEVMVKLYGEWGDFVFDPGYKLRTLNELENYIISNKHLPEVPSADEIKSTGINLGEMDALLMKKVEELTLYVIEQQKILDSQQKMIERQQIQIDELINR